MRITIKNVDNLDMRVVSWALGYLDEEKLKKHTCYKSKVQFLPDLTVEVFYRVTPHGYAVDIHKS